MLCRVNEESQFDKHPFRFLLTQSSCALSPPWPKTMLSTGQSNVSLAWEVYVSSSYWQFEILYVLSVESCE
ncbi:hypothetical protein PRUPE_1G123400 [Prunus persica]|uniref:Uncharacterized protein n=1 Tax=Prunus persica TaxID=3760 RepID=M5XLJ5_PRUPE|nr:hypothetical protein PRUPE_1G123400 [Prunus persica]